MLNYYKKYNKAKLVKRFERFYIIFRLLELFNHKLKLINHRK